MCAVRPEEWAITILTGLKGGCFISVSEKRFWLSPQLWAEQSFISDAVWRRVSASEQAQLLQLLERVLVRCHFLLMLSMSAKSLLLSVRQSRGRWEPLLAWSPKMIQGGWSCELQGKGCHSFLPLFQPSLFCLALHTVKNRRLSLPTRAEVPKQNLWNSKQGVKFLLFILFKSATLRCAAAAASPLSGFSAAKDSISRRAGHLSESGFKSQPDLSMSCEFPFCWIHPLPLNPLQQRASLIQLVPCNGVLFMAKALRDTTVTHASVKGPMMTGKKVEGRNILSGRSIRRDQNRTERTGCWRSALEPLQWAHIAYRAFCANCLQRPKV